MMNNVPLSLYIHFPWCVKKCPYCDFNSHQASTTIPTDDYIKALIADFKQEYSFIAPQQIQSIFMGGGTPSLFHAKDLEPLFEVILLHCIENVEITLEANPGTIERGQFKDYRQLGINRISLGAQSFNEAQLKKLGRIHQSHDVNTAVAEIRRAGFERFNLDLMHGLPDQSFPEAIEDLHKAIALQPTHLSWYQLTLEPNTYFAVHPPVLPDDDALAEIEAAGFEILARHGFSRYEISAFAQNHDYCQHNLNYWHFGDYLGIGAGAHGKITLNQKIIRSTKPKLPKSYLNLYGESGSQQNKNPPKIIMPTALPFEFMLNALRLTNGFAKTLFEARTGLNLKEIQTQIDQAKAKSLLVETTTHLQPTAFGLRFLNNLLGQFL